MKLVRFAIVLSGLFGFLFFSSCNYYFKKTESNNNLTLDTIRINKIHSPNNDSTNFKCKIDLTFIYPKTWSDENGLKKLQSIFIRETLQEQFANLTPQEATEAFVAQYFAEFDSIAFEEYPMDEYEMEDETGFAYYMQLKNEITYNQNQFISFAVETHLYEGGAHGSNNIHGYVINLNSKKLLKEEDFSGINYSQNMAGLMKQKLAKKNELSDPNKLENIGYTSLSDIKPNGNFTIDEKGITYYFNEYEIAAYFLGTTRIFIPYEEFNIYLMKYSPISSISDI